MTLLDLFFNHKPLKKSDIENNSLSIPSALLKKNLQARNNPNKYICNAPFNSLRFERYGKVFVCCHNNSFLAGFYPEQSLKEIWEGIALLNFRKTIKKNKLHNGCSICYDAIISGKINSLSALMFDNYPINAHYPTVLDFKTDNTCNLSCIMCFSFSSCKKESEAFDKNKAFEPYNDDFIKNLSPFLINLKEIRFSGGEPFLSEFYFKLWDKLIEINPKCIITVQTNANVFNDRIKSILEKACFSVNVSLDSLDNEVYKKIRINGSLETALKNIDYFSNYCKVKKTKFSITICPMRYNVNELFAIIQFCNNLKAFIWFSIVWYPIKHALWSLPLDVMQELSINLKKLKLPENNEVEKYNKSIFLEFLSSINVWIEQTIQSQDAELFDIKKYKEKIYKTIEAYFDNMLYAPDEERKIRKIAFQQKAAFIIEKLSTCKIPECSFDLLFKYNNENMFMEVLEMESMDSILENIQSLFDKYKGQKAVLSNNFTQ